MRKEGTIRLNIKDHFSFDPERPERFNWRLALNPKVQNIGDDIAAEIVLRREEWARSGRSGQDPLIVGMQEALRRIARIAVWVTMTESKARLASMERELVDK